MKRAIIRSLFTKSQAESSSTDKGLFTNDKPSLLLKKMAAQGSEMMVNILPQFLTYQVK